MTGSFSFLGVKASGKLSPTSFNLSGKASYKGFSLGASKNGISTGLSFKGASFGYSAGTISAGLGSFGFRTNFQGNHTLSWGFLSLNLTEIMNPAYVNTLSGLR